MSDYLLRKHQQRVADAVAYARANENAMYEKTIHVQKVEIAALKAEIERLRKLLPKTEYEFS